MSEVACVSERSQKLLRYCSDRYSSIVDVRTPPIVVAPGRKRTASCGDCDDTVQASALRQVVRGDNRRARVCARCARA